MKSHDAARTFADLFHRLYLTFYQRHPPTEYQPSREALALLQHLAATGPLTVTEAARHFSRSQAATSELIRRLERRDLVERIADERDRRRHLVWLTAKGRRAWEDSADVLSVELLTEAMDNLRADQRIEIVSALKGLLETTEAVE